MYIQKELQNRLRDGRPFGFCPWEDGDGMLWGVLLNLTEIGFQVQEIGTLGEDDGVEWYEFDGVSGFDFGEPYGERLRRLRDFSPTRPNFGFGDEPNWINRSLAEAKTSNEIISIAIAPDESTEAVRVIEIESGWITVQHHDDIMEPNGISSFRMERVARLRIGSCHEESYTFLEDSRWRT